MLALFLLLEWGGISPGAPTGHRSISASPSTTSSVGGPGTSKPTGPVTASLTPRSEVTAPGVAASADLRIGAAADLVSVEVTVATAGPVTLVGNPRRSLGSVPEGTEVTLPLDYTITGVGAGELRATVTGQGRDGSAVGAWTLVVYLLGSPPGALHGRSGPLDLQLLKLDRDHAAGLLGDAAYATAVDATLGQGATEAASRTRSGKTLTVTGRIAWTDRAGTVHPVRLALVEIRDAQLGVAPMTTTTTDLDGRYSVTVMNVGPGGRDILVRVYAQGPGFAIRRLGGAVQRIQSALHSDVPDGTTLTIDLTANNSMDNNTAFSVHDALVTADQYVRRVRSAPLPDLDVLFPSPFGTFYAGTFMSLLRLDRFDWDVVLHEYGHHVSSHLGIEASPGGPHGPVNMGEFIGKDAGIRIAWGEGWPTYFGTSLQQVMGTRALSIPYVGDTRYTDTEDFDLDYDLETQTGGFASFPRFVVRSTGEDNEISVQRILWDLFDGADDAGDNGVALGDAAIWNLLDAANPTTLSAAYAALTGGRPAREVARIGCIFSEHRVAPAPTAPNDGHSANQQPPTFRWEANGGGPSNRNNRFVVEVYDASFATRLFASPEQSTTSFTPTQAQWDTIRRQAGGQLHWLVQGHQTNAPETGPYRSCARSLEL